MDLGVGAQMSECYILTCVSPNSCVKDLSPSVAMFRNCGFTGAIRTKGSHKGGPLSNSTLILLENEETPGILH